MRISVFDKILYRGVVHYGQHARRLASHRLVSRKASCFRERLVDSVCTEDRSGSALGNRPTMIGYYTRRNLCVNPGVIKDTPQGRNFLADIKFHYLVMKYKKRNIFVHKMSVVKKTFILSILYYIY